MVPILCVFGKTIDRVAFLVSDNCSLNKRLARLLGVPLVGCASHRLNLAVTLVTASLESVLVKTQGLMVRLRTLNESAKLRFKTKLRPVLRQDTRRGSTFKMLHHYFDLLEFIDRDDENLVEFIPSASENKKLKVLLTTLELIQSVSMQLQSDGVTLWEICVLFDALLKEMPALKRYLGATGSIVASPDFESACVKVQSDKQNPISRQEKAACQRFLREPQNEVNLQGSSQQGFAASVLKKLDWSQRKKRVQTRPRDPSHIQPC